MKKETRSIEIRAAPDKQDYIVEGYATTFDAPYELFEYDGIKYYECIERGALEGADMSDVIMQYDHAGKVLARTSNGTLKLECDEHGLKIRADLSKSAAAKELYEEISNGLITRMSWCFTIDEHKYNIKTHTDTLTRIGHVYDVSAVSIPANDDTSISAARNRAEALESAGTLARRAMLLDIDITLNT